MYHGVYENYNRLTQNKKAIIFASNVASSIQLVNDFTPQYYAYLEDCKQNDEPSNLRFISDNFLHPFLLEAMKLRDVPGYEKPICRKLVVSASNIRKDISEIEFNCIHYAKDIEKQFEEYFSEENKHLKELKRLKLEIDNKLNE